MRAADFQEMRMGRKNKKEDGDEKGECQEDEKNKEN